MKKTLTQLAPQLQQHGILPVYCPQNEAEFETFRAAVLASPIRMVEITLRNRFAVEALARLKREEPSLTVAAGTILSEELLLTAVDAGADCLVAPGYSQELLQLAEEKEIPFLPGCVTPSEIQNAFRRGYTIQKFFPAAINGGPAALTLYKGAFSSVSFVPTGGITLDNLSSYLALSNVLACGGSFMLPKAMLAAGDSEGIYHIIQNCLAIRGGTQ